MVTLTRNPALVESSFATQTQSDHDFAVDTVIGQMRADVSYPFTATLHGPWVGPGIGPRMNRNPTTSRLAGPGVPSSTVNRICAALTQIRTFVLQYVQYHAEATGVYVRLTSGRIHDHGYSDPESGAR